MIGRSIGFNLATDETRIFNTEDTEIDTEEKI